MTTCLECGGPLPTGLKPWAQFCKPACRITFNNRRATRGAELYDLFMALRYDREKATVLGVWAFLCKLGQLYREDDIRNHDGRRTWNDPKVVLDRKPWLKYKVFRV